MNRTSSALKRIRDRSLWLLVLLLVTGTLAYPRPLNWAIDQVNRTLHVGIGSVQKPFVLGLDLQGGTHLEYEADVSRVADADRAEALNGVRDVIERRVNTLGVSEPLIQTTQAGESWRVTVELAGIRDVNQAIKLIGETPILEFKEVNEDRTPALTPEQSELIRSRNEVAKQAAQAGLNEVRKPGADFAALATAQAQLTTVTTTDSDLGFLQSNVGYADLYEETKAVPVGTVLDHVVDRANEFLVAKVEEEKETGVEVNAHHLLVSYKGARQELSTRTKEEAKTKIDGLKAIATLENFDRLVRENSDEPGAAERNGDLDWFGKGAMVEPFEKAVFAQKVGTISDVVETEFGYHLIWKIAERPIRDVRVHAIRYAKLSPEDVAPPADEWKDTKLTGRQLSSARVDFDPQVGTPVVSLQFDDEGAKLFADLTKRNIGKPIAIFLDGQAISVPIVNTEIIGGRAVIQGNFTAQDAKLLARRLQAGALPVPITIVAQQTVGPSLGAESLRASLIAGLAGFVLVALFMILLYRLPGVVSVVALILYAAISATVFKLVPVTLTLSGIAGFILSLGIAVDANVLTFERLKEELATSGRSLALSLEEAFKRAWPSIRDGHVTVLISCAVLYWFSSSIIRGFALTLAVGVVTSLFTAVVSTRTILRLLATTKVAERGWLFLKKDSRS